MKIGDCLFHDAVNPKGCVVATFAGVIVKKDWLYYYTRSIKNVEDRRIYRIFRFRKLTRMGFTWACVYMYNCHRGNEEVLHIFCAKSTRDLLNEGHYSKQENIN